MPINEQMGAMGDWQVTLLPETPRSIRQAVADPFGHIVIAPAWVDPDSLSDAGMLAVARYTGVVVEPGPQLELAGYGLAWWLGSPDNQGAFKTSGSWFFSSDTFADVYEELLGDDLDLGVTVPSGGSYSGQFNHITRRQAIEEVAKTFGHVWRVNPDGSFEIEEPTSLYPSPTVAIIDGRSARGPGGVDVVDADIQVRRDYELWASHVEVQGRDGHASGTGVATSDYKSLTGNNVQRSLLFDGKDLDVSILSATASTLFDKYGVDEGRRLVDVSARDRDVTSLVNCGDRVWVYDPLDGLEDTSNFVWAAGEPTWPVEMQVSAMRWPVLRGMGVYHRRYLQSDSAPVWTDLTPYVEFESGDAELEVFVGTDADRWEIDTAVSRDVEATASERAQAKPWTSYTPTWTNGGTAPTVGNSTFVGAFRREGTTLFCRGSMTVGSTASVGSGEMRLSLPSGLTFAAGQVQVGSAFWFNSSAPVVVRGVALCESNAAYVNFQFVDTGVRHNANQLASGDGVGFNLAVEIND